MGFEDEGFVVLRGAFSQEDAGLSREMIWRHIESSSPVRFADPGTWEYDGNFGLRAVEERAVWHAVHTNESVRAALDELFGPGEWSPPGPPQVLLTFPEAGPWRMPSGWHVDFGDDDPVWPVSAVKMFALLDAVEPAGGGTLLLAGSHLIDTIEPADFTSGLLAGGGDRDLLGVATEVKGVTTTPVEITGDAGDIFLTHMRVFHSPAPNVTSRPRQMLANAFRRRP